MASEAATVLVLFDIDGTLVTPDGAGSRALRAAGSALFGDAFSVDELDPSGKMDLAILEELADRHPGLDVRGRARELTALYVAALRREAPRMRPLPGAAAILTRLAAEPRVALGILTGNYRVAATLKLKATGLAGPGDRDPFAVRACGDEAGSRAELVDLARSRFLAGPGAGAPDPALVMVGDSPRDVEAGNARGVPVLGVATGRWSEADLAAAGADRVVPDLLDPEPLLELVRRARTPS